MVGVTFDLWVGFDELDDFVFGRRLEAAINTVELVEFCVFEELEDFLFGGKVFVDCRVFAGEAIVKMNHEAIVC